jgi:hypothetical protein
MLVTFVNQNLIAFNLNRINSIINILTLYKFILSVVYEIISYVVLKTKH